MAKRWQGAKAARKGLGPWWNVLRAGFETLSNCRISTWQGKVAAKGERCTGGFPVLVKRAWPIGVETNRLKCNIRPGKALWQRAKAAQEGFGALVGNVLRAGFETFSKCRISTWQGKGKGRWQSAAEAFGALVERASRRF